MFDCDLALDSGNINYQLAAKVASALNWRSAGELAELKAVTVPVRMSGTYAALSIALDFANASGGLVTRRIAAKAAAEQAAAKAAAEQAMPAKRTAPPTKQGIKASKK